jgi:hypothetical protein
MNDFSDIENELRALRPVRPSQALLQSVAQQLDGSAEVAETAENIIRPSRFRAGWLSLGLGLAAAAALFVLARIDLPKVLRNAPALAAMTPNPSPATGLASAQFIPAGATRVVYHTQDEGLLFPGGAAEPVRRVRSRSRETLQWHNPGTGASLRVSYPSEEVQLIPIGGQ